LSCDIHLGFKLFEHLESVYGKQLRYHENFSNGIFSCFIVLAGKVLVEEQGETKFRAREKAVEQACKIYQLL
jgi:hypothetical protein